MKLYAGVVAVLLVGCAASPAATDNGPVARCTVADCFNTRNIRDFAVLNNSTAVVFVGSQRCPFVIDLDGFSCNPSVAPRLRFYQAGMAGVANAGMSGRVCRSTQQLYVYTGIADIGPSAPGAVDPVTGRPNGLGGLGDFGGLNDSGVRPLGGVVPPRDSDLCHVRDIHSITDDQLLELYVKAGVVPPPPPIGGGKIEVPGGPGGSGGAAGPAEAPAAPGAGASPQGEPPTAAGQSKGQSPQREGESQTEQ